MSKKVAVLIAAYNGEKYLSEQIDSIIKQTYKNVVIYIRDDGSEDKTPAIIRQYCEFYPNVIGIFGKKNLGYPGCFYALTDMKIDADYFMFADQDDVWLENKIERAVKRLNKENNEIPICYFAGYKICDSQLNFIRDSNDNDRKIQFKDTLFEVCGLEFTMAINKCALDFLSMYKPQKAKARGTWMCMLFSAFGKIVYENEPCAFYRRHDTAVTCSQTGFWGFQLWRLKTFFINNEFKEYKIILKDLKQVAGDLMTDKNRKILRIFTEDRYFPGFIKKVFYPHRLRSRLFDEIALRVVFLIGKL